MKKPATKFFIGTSGWAYQDWKNVFYPPEVPQNGWLSFYAKHFNSVELNSTFYRNFQNKNYQHWYEMVPSDFRFVIKVSRYITHKKRLINVVEEIQQAETKASILQKKLGLLLLQLPPDMEYNLDLLDAALLAFKDPRKVVVEFRGECWITEEMKSLLSRHQAIFCNVDSPSFAIKDWLTSEIGYIRLHGHTKMYDGNYTQSQLERIAMHAKTLACNGAKEVYIFFNNDAHGYAINNAKTLKTILENSHVT